MDIVVKNASLGVVDCNFLFKDLSKQANASAAYMPLDDVQANGNNYLRDVIYLPDVPFNYNSGKIVFRIGTHNACVHMVVDPSTWDAGYVDPWALIRRHQEAVCHKDVFLDQLPDYTLKYYACAENVSSTHWDGYTSILAQVKSSFAFEFTFMEGTYDDWYGLYIGVLASLVGSVVALAACCAGALLGAFVPEKRTNSPLPTAELAKRRAKKDEQEKRLETISQKIEDMCDRLQTVEAMHATLQRLEAMYAKNSSIPEITACTVVIEQKGD